MNGVAYRVNATTHKFLSFVLLELVVLQSHAIPERDGNVDDLVLRNRIFLSEPVLSSRLFILGETPLNFDRDGAFGGKVSSEMIVFSNRGVHGEKNATLGCAADEMEQTERRRVYCIISRRFQGCHIMLTEENTQCLGVKGEG